MSDNRERSGWFTLCLVVAAVAFCIGAKIGQNDGIYSVRREAIEAGAARYECDPQTGETRFVWGGKSSE